MRHTPSGLLALALMSLVSCPPRVPDRQADSAIVIAYVDLTGSINQEVANRVVRNVEKLFQNTPPKTKFYLYSIDSGTSKPDIYEFVPELSEIKTAADQAKRSEELDKLSTAKADAGTEFGKLKTELSGYLAYISVQKGAVSCLTNKLNSLWDTAKNKHDSSPNSDLKIYFYSDMIEECKEGFDGKPLDFKKQSSPAREKRHLDEIFERIDHGFPSDSSRNLKALGAKIHIVLTSQDDKQDYWQLRAIWSRLFERLGYSQGDMDNKQYFYWGDGTDDILWKFGR